MKCAAPFSLCFTLQLEGHSELYKAAVQGNMAVVEALLKAGAAKDPAINEPDQVSSAHCSPTFLEKGQ